MIELDARFLRQPPTGVLGNDRADDLQDLLARQRMARCIVRSAVGIEEACGRAGGEAQSLRRLLGHGFQQAFDGAHDLVTSVSATMWAELINSVRSASST